MNLSEYLGLFVDKMIKTQQSPEFHPEGNVWVHTMLVVGQLVGKYLNKQELHWAGLFHDIGKVHTTKWNKDKQRWTAYGHEKVSVNIWNNAVKNGLIPNHLDCDCIEWLIDNHMKKHIIDKMGDEKRNKLMSHEWYPLLDKLGDADDMVVLFNTTTENQRKEYLNICLRFLQHNVKGSGQSKVTINNNDAVVTNNMGTLDDIFKQQESTSDVDQLVKDVIKIWDEPND